MENFNVKINLSRLRGVQYLKKDGEVYICIPQSRNFIFNGEKGFYLDCLASRLKEPKYNESHLIKMSVPKDVYDKLTEEQKMKIPIIGSLSPFAFEIKGAEMKNVEKFDEIPKNAKVDEEDDLPF